MKNLDIAFLQSELKRISEWIQFSDKKTAFLSVYYSAIFGLLFSQEKSILRYFETNHGLILNLYIFTFIAIILSFFIGVFYLFRSIFPILKNKSTDQSLFYFRHIANIKLFDYLEKVRKLTKEETRKQIIEQIHTNSIIADKKMRNIQKSIISLFLLAFFVILFFIFHLKIV